MPIWRPTSRRRQRAPADPRKLRRPACAADLDGGAGRGLGRIQAINTNLDNIDDPEILAITIPTIPTLGSAQIARKATARTWAMFSEEAVANRDAQWRLEQARALPYLFEKTADGQQPRWTRSVCGHVLKFTSIWCSG